MVQSWLDEYSVPICIQCGNDTSNKSRICTVCRGTCPLCGRSKSYAAKTCRTCQKKRGKSKRRSTPTTITLANGATVTTRSRLEAEWILTLEGCDPCYECVPLKILKKGRRGSFTGKYTPDLAIEVGDEKAVFLELKPNKKTAQRDTRAKRALAINKESRFLIIGGYPGTPLYVRMLSSDGVKEYEGVTTAQVLQLLGCGVL